MKPRTAEQASSSSVEIPLGDLAGVFHSEEMQDFLNVDWVGSDQAERVETFSRFQGKMVETARSSGHNIKDVKEAVLQNFQKAQERAIVEKNGEWMIKYAGAEGYLARDLDGGAIPSGS